MIINKHADLTKPAFKTVSEDAKNFIRSCLTHDIDKRASAEQLLKHKWLVNLSDLIDKVASEDDQQNVL